ncbi:TadE family type IV pilus minor pilin [Kribbella sandramycini]|uniref:TadE family type IV pilus minor pilin n=1 Tax=Kribbella sandramycini TaxID=60450 RepID=UPI003B5197A2
MTRRRPAPPAATQQGAVTVELALTLPLLLTLLTASLYTLSLLTTHLRAVDASRDIARALARNEPPETIRHLTQTLPPPNSTVTLQTTPTIRVTIHSTPPHPFPLLPTPTTKAQSTLHPEPPN